LGGRLYLLDAETGFERSCWEADDALHSSPSEIGSRVFFGARDGMLRALDVRVFAEGKLTE
jgi:hypothetical protein